MTAYMWLCSLFSSASSILDISATLIFLHFRSLTFNLSLPADVGQIDVGQIDSFREQSNWIAS